MKKSLAWFLAVLVLLTGVAGAEQAATEAVGAPAVERKGLSLGAGSVYYPQLSGLDDLQVQDKVNALILSEGQIEAYLNRLALTMSSAVPLTVDYSAYLSQGVFSSVQSARGPLADERITHVYTAVNVDLQTGEEITWKDLFVDETAARNAVEEYLITQVAPELSAHLAGGELLPLPDVFSLSASGITLYYPIRQLSTLSDRAGSVSLLWSELREHLNLQAGGVLARLGVERMLRLDGNSREPIGQAVTAGCLPDLPVALGGSVQEVTDTFGLLVDPDLYAQGRLFQLEDGAFRGVYLLTDGLTETWENSVIQGIRADRINLYGLCTGQTKREAWLDALGAPDATVTMDAEQAEAYRMLPGTSDYYRFGERQLRLHADENGVLASVIIN